MIRFLQTTLWLAAAGLLALRLFTGIVYENDAPDSAYVLKHTPSLFVERRNDSPKPMQDRFTILYSDENQLFFEDFYVALMRDAFMLSLALAVMGLLCARLRAHP